MSGIEFSRRLSTSLAYHVLSHLDLGGDAANLFRGRSSTKAWVRALETAYVSAGTERLELQFAGLVHEDVDALLARAAESKSPLWRIFLRALEAERVELEARFFEGEREARSIFDESERHLTGPLRQLRSALWAPRTPPPLTVLHVPSLVRAGRGYPQRDRHLVAVSLAAPAEQVLLQIFHEEVHPVSDPELARLGLRDTRLGAPGARVHQRIEAHALERGAEVIARSAPELSPAYERWRAQWSAPVRAQGAQTLR
jgi:hypothetical protein